MNFNERQLKAINHNEHPALVVASAGSGKCITGDSLVYTNYGLFRMEDIPNYFNVDEFDRVCLDVKGFNMTSKKLTKSNTSHFYNMGESKTIKVNTSYGFSIEGTYEHPIVIKDINGEIKFKRLSEISASDKVAISLNNNLFGNSTEDESKAYTFGFNLLHGTRIRNTILMGTKEVVKTFLKGLFDDNKCNIVISNNKPKINIVWHYNSLAFEENITIIQMLLLNFGILSKRINNILEIEGSYLKRLYDEIIRYSVDTELWDDYFSKHPEYSTIEDIYFDTIISIEPSKYTKTVYDFTVPYEHSFVANGIINHNTTLLLERIRTLVEEVRIPQEDILTISFTRASADELRNKLKKLGLDRVDVGTFHSVCRTLMSSKYDFNSFVNTYNLKIFMSKKTNEYDLNLDDILSWISYQKSNNIRHNDLEFKDKESMYTVNQLRQYYKLYEEFKQMNKCYDFDDWLLLTLDEYTKPNLDSKIAFGFAKALKKWRYIIVDEAQDNNVVQNLLIDQWCYTDNVMLIGDHKQSIYSFRGAEPEYFMNFYKKYPSCDVITLNINYRSCQQIVDNSNEFIKKYYGFYEKHEDSIANKKDDGFVENYVNPDKPTEAEEVLREIKRLHIVEGVPYSEMSVIYRNHSNADIIETLLKKDNIPYKIFSNGSWLDKFEIKGILMLLRLIKDVTDDEAFEFIFKTFRPYPIKYLKGALFKDVTEIAAENDISYFEAFMELEHRTKNKYEINNIRFFINGINRLKIQTEKKLSVEKLITNICTLFRINEIIERKYPIDSWQDHFESISNLKSISSKMQLEYFLNYITNIPSKPSNVDGITLQTIHHSKGLEYDVVFLIGLENKKFPSEKSSIYEESRLFYVGITRARERLYISSINESTFYNDYIN